ncbi:MAG: hypothetical protein GY749_29230, partial [Desulfobacteraceae bacterium]|nr:hypothetical protein [Desulfobacteraceae bacterium]
MYYEFQKQGAVCLMNQHLFLFTIGPVQSFILQARKTQDLHAGSEILSALIDEAMKACKNMAATEFIYPSPGIESKPNRFIAAIDSEKPDDCGKAAENAVREKF